MPIVNVDELIRLQRKTEDVRNICILAHVDHGKTSLTDSLIATNGIISPKLAGKIRYLDSRPDEQTRGITMESSAISLYYPMLRRPAPDAAPQKKEYLVNLIDSPGHIDFSSEVSTASRLCDGALVLVDAVEGVCSQTVTVLRHTWVEQLRPILVINKLDRLVTELKMSAEEAYAHMTRLLEQVNAVIGSFYQGERMEEDLQWRERMEERVKAAAEEKDRAKKEHPSAAQADADSAVTEYEERDDEDLYFSPEKNNVIFCSATDGWAFTVRQFASMYEKKLGIKRAALEKCLWGDYYLDPKTKRVLGQKHLKGRNLKPTFVQLVLDTIWAVYNATIGGDNGKGDSVLLEKITKSLGITIPPYVLRSRDPRATLTTIFLSWLPLSNAVLITVIEYLPNPLTSQAARMPNIIRNSPGSEAVSPAIEQAMAKFDSSPDAPVVAYVSKMVAIPESELPSATKRNGTGSTNAQEARELARKKREEIMKLQQSQASSKENDSFARISSVLQDTSLDEPPPEEPVKEDPEHLIGFARLYSGTLKVGDSVYVLPPKFNPAKAHTGPELKKVTITALYLLMGRNLEKLESVPAGSVFGIGGLQGQILKTGTLCSQVAGGINLAGVSLSSPPIVRVALEPVNPADLTKMITGLKLLEEADPCAQYEVLPNGEHVILTAGELHLERCLKDLRERFARCDITPGAPIVPYRETTVVAPDMPPPKNVDPQTQTPLARGTVISTSASRLLTLQLRVRPLPPAVTDFLVKHEATIKSLHAAKHGRQAAPVAASGENGVGENGEAGEAGEAGEVGEEEDDEEGRAIGILSADEFKKQLGQVLDQAGNESGDDVWKTVLDQVIEFGPRRMGANMLVDMTAGGSGERVLALTESGSHADHPTAHNLQLFSDKIAYAFQLAVARGPLCHEPVQGLAVLVERLVVADGAEDELGRLTGEIIRSVRDAVHQGLLDWSPRVMLAMYSCEIQASTEVLGRVYSVITRRRGRILSETMKEGTPFFTIVSLLPVAESFGFAEEMRKRTSGAASPQLIFSGFEMLDQDPFWVPATEEELEDLGELADRENVAKRYMDSVRERKGLAVKGKKLIKDAEKQKTLKR